MVIRKADEITHYSQINYVVGIAHPENRKNNKSLKSSVIHCNSVSVKEFYAVKNSNENNMELDDSNYEDLLERSRLDMNAMKHIVKNMLNGPVVISHEGVAYEDLETKGIEYVINSAIESPRRIGTIEKVELTPDGRIWSWILLNKTLEADTVRKHLWDGQLRDLSLGYIANLNSEDFKSNKPIDPEKFSFVELSICFQGRLKDTHIVYLCSQDNDKQTINKTESIIENSNPEDIYLAKSKIVINLNRK
jgi:hypothetical protein